MNISPLDQIILAADTDQCAAFFQTMSESQRKVYAGRALQWASAINGYACRNRQQYMSFDKAMAKDFEFYQSIQAHAVVFPKDFTEKSFPASRVAMLATCALPELKRAGVLALPEPKLAAAIMMARKPTWLNKWCAYLLKEFPTTHWLAIYELEKSGACIVERSPGYWMAMLCSLPNTDGMYECILACDEKVRGQLWDMLGDPGVARMLAEPEQIAHEIFRKRWNSGGNIFAPKQVSTRKGTEVWQEALLRLASDGLIDQSRLIEYSFTTLAAAAEKESKKSTYADVSTADFAIRLNQEVTKNNSASYTSQFSALLGATHKDVSTYASTVLASMPEGMLNVAEICACVAPAFLNKSKEPADAALKLLSRLAKEQPSRRSDYGSAILAAFGHSSKDIHKKALALVESTKMLEDQVLLCEFRQRMDMLAGMERTNAVKLADRFQLSESTALGCAASAVPVANADELYARANNLDKAFRALALIDDAIEATRSGLRLDASVILDTLEFPRLNPTAAVKPIDSLNDLVYMFTKVWSGKSDLLELEALLDGISRLCCERPSDFKQKTDVLRQKAHAVTQEFSTFGPSGSLAHLTFCWLGEASPYSGPTIGSDSGSFFMRRCLAVAKRAATKVSAPLLAAPTHAGAWIDAEILVERLLKYFWLKIEPDKVDFIQALLRLAPDNRTAALEAAASSKGEMGEALRYALGGREVARIVTPEYWVAAFRARDPKGTSSELARLLPDNYPDGAGAAKYGFDIEPVRHFASDRYASISAGLPDFLPVSLSRPDCPSAAQEADSRPATSPVLNAVARSQYALFPTVTLHDNSNTWFAGNQTYSWLHNRESLLALHAKRLLQNIDSVGTYWQSDYEWLFDPDTSMAGNGRYVICIAMSSKNNDLARLAVDALIAAVALCRISASAYGEAMANLLPSGAITPVRWVRGLRDMSRTSALHAHFVWQAISIVIANAPITPTQQIPFLELLVELQVEYRFKPDQLLVNVLGGVTGDGKGAKLAKTVLTLKGEDNSVSNAALQDLESRISRAERWQNWIRAGRKEAAV